MRFVAPRLTAAVRSWRSILCCAVLLGVGGRVQAGNIGNWNGGNRSWNDPAFATIRQTMADAGHVVEPDGELNAANLANDHVFVMGEPVVDPSAPELVALYSWLRGGGILVILTAADGTGVHVGNIFMSSMGSSMHFSGTAQILDPFAGGVFATEGPPYDVVGQTPDVSVANRVIGGNALAGDFIRYEKIGHGYIFAHGQRVDHDVFNPTSATVNGEYFLNLAQVHGDFDGDGDVDLDDFEWFLTCATGPGGGILPDCEAGDLDLDGDVDRADFAGFQSSFTGPMP